MEKSDIGGLGTDKVEPKPFERDLSGYTKKIEIETLEATETKHFHFRKIKTDDLIEYDHDLVYEHFREVLRNTDDIKSLKHEETIIEQIWEPPQINFK